MPDLPFDWNITTTRWDFDDKSYLILEKTLQGYSMYGRVDGKPFDNDGEDFFFADSDELLDFLTKHKMTALLSCGVTPDKAP